MRRWFIRLGKVAPELKLKVEDVWVKVSGNARAGFAVRDVTWCGAGRCGMMNLESKVWSMEDDWTNREASNGDKKCRGHSAV